MARVQPLDPTRRWTTLSLVLTDDAGIRPVNETYFGKPVPTDVISFRYDPLPGEPPGDSGEVVVNVERALTEGNARGSVDRELALYIAHGCHHLAGATDETPAARAAMRRVENAWLAAAAEAGHLDLAAATGEAPS